MTGRVDQSGAFLRRKKNNKIGFTGPKKAQF